MKKYDKVVVQKGRGSGEDVTIEECRGDFFLVRDKKGNRYPKYEKNLVPRQQIDNPSTT